VLTFYKHTKKLGVKSEFRGEVEGEAGALRSKYNEVHGLERHLKKSMNCKLVLGNFYTTGGNKRPRAVQLGIYKGVNGKVRGSKGIFKPPGSAL